MLVSVIVLSSLDLVSLSYILLAVWIMRLKPEPREIRYIKIPNQFSQNKPPAQAALYNFSMGIMVFSFTQTDSQKVFHAQMNKQN